MFRGILRTTNDPRHRVLLAYNSPSSWSGSASPRLCVAPTLSLSSKGIWLVALAWLACLAGCGEASIAVPDAAAVRAATLPSDHRLLDRHGVVLAERRVDLNRRRLSWSPRSAISPALVEAVIAAEDRRFAEHTGVDGRALARAAWNQLRHGNGGGASTITMQVAALIGLTPAATRGRDLAGKLHQMRAAWALERAWSKDAILETYLNRAPFRGEIEGITAAAQLLFDREPHALTRAQSIVLAASLRAPNATADRLRRRALHLAQRLGDVATDAIDAAVARVVAVPSSGPPRPSLAPHVATRLLRAEVARDVSTTLDASLQRIAVESLHRQLTALAEDGVRDGAVLAVDNRTGAVLVYIGSSGSLSTARHVDGVRARRQAGSTLKPFLYAAALDSRRWTAASLLDDTPLDLAVGGASYRPSNYDRKHRGGVPLRLALASSLNVPAVRLLSHMDAESIVRRLRDFGLATIDKPADFYGPGLALGVAEIRLWDLVAAYRSLARGGVPGTLHLTPRDEAPTETEATVVSPESAFIVADILTDRSARSAAFGLDSPLETPFAASVKTGTSTDMRDNWCVGFTEAHTVGVWVGNFSGAPMGKVSGVSGAAPVWNEVLRALEGRHPSSPRVPPPGVERVGDEWYLAGTAPVGGRTLAAPPAPAIIEPIDGAALALDPGIPEAAQRVRFVAQGTDKDWSWHLAGQRLTAADSIYLWSPRPGIHHLQLIDPDGKVRDSVRFRVRGTGDRTTASQPTTRNDESPVVP